MAQKDLPYWQVEGTKAVVVVMMVMMMAMGMMTMVADISHLICIGIRFTDITLFNPHHNAAIRSIIILT